MAKLNRKNRTDEKPKTEPTTKVVVLGAKCDGTHTKVNVDVTIKDIPHVVKMRVWHDNQAEIDFVDDNRLETFANAFRLTGLPAPDFTEAKELACKISAKQKAEDEKMYAEAEAKRLAAEWPKDAIVNKLFPKLAAMFPGITTGVDKESYLKGATAWIEVAPKFSSSKIYISWWEKGTGTIQVRHGLSKDERVKVKKIDSAIAKVKDYYDILEARAKRTHDEIQKNKDVVNTISKLFDKKFAVEKETKWNPYAGRSGGYNTTLYNIVLRKHSEFHKDCIVLSLVDTNKKMVTVRGISFSITFEQLKRLVTAVTTK